MKLSTSIIACLAATCGFAGAVTVQLSAFGAGNQTILGDSLGSPLNGMTWGILVDTGANGFADFSSTTVPGSLSDGFLGGTDDYMFISANLTSNFAGSDGTATQIIFNLNTDVTGGEAFGVVWFESGAAGSDITPGTPMGFVTDAALVVPPANGNTIQPTALRGASPAGSATLTYGVIPEPSVTLLGALGLLGLLRRRR